MSLYTCICFNGNMREDIIFLIPSHSFFMIVFWFSFILSSLNCLSPAYVERVGEWSGMGTGKDGRTLSR